MEGRWILLRGTHSLEAIGAASHSISRIDRPKHYGKILSLLSVLESLNDFFWTGDPADGTS